MLERKFITEGEFAKIVGVSVDTVRRMVRDGTIPYVKLSPRIRFIPHDALNIMFMEAQERRYRDMYAGFQSAPQELPQPVPQEFPLLSAHDEPVVDKKIGVARGFIDRLAGN